MAVYYCQTVIVVFRGYLSGRIGTESSHFIIKGRRMVYQLGLIEILIQKFHHLIPDFHPDSNIHRTYFRLDILFPAHMAEPVCSFSSDGADNLCPVKCFPRVGNHACGSAVFHKNMFYHGTEFHFNSLLQQMFLQAHVNLVPLFCAQMADGTFYQFQIGIDGFTAYFPDFFLFSHTVNTGIRTEFQINLVGFPYQLHRFVIPQNFRQIPAHIRRKRQFPVGKSPCSCKSCGNGTGLTSHTDFCLAFGTLAFFNPSSLFQHQHPDIGLLVNQFICTENTGRPGSHNNYIIVFHSILLSYASTTRYLPSGSTNTSDASSRSSSLI